MKCDRTPYDLIALGEFFGSDTYTGRGSSKGSL